MTKEYGKSGRKDTLLIRFWHGVLGNYDTHSSFGLNNSCFSKVHSNTIVPLKWEPSVLNAIAQGT